MTDSKRDPTPDDDLAQWDAAYVLGALSRDDRRMYEDFLAADPVRSSELTELAAMPDLLGALSREEALALTDLGDGAPADRGIASLAEAAAKRQRRARRTAMAAAVGVAAALAIVGGVVGARVFPSASTSVPAVALAPMQSTPREGLTAQLAVTEKKWGTELHWACEYTGDWTRSVDSYDIVVTTRDGAQTAVGSWRPAGDEATGLSAATSIPTSQIRSVDIRVTGSDEPLAVRSL